MIAAEEMRPRRPGDGEYRSVRWRDGGRTVLGMDTMNDGRLLIVWEGDCWPGKVGAEFRVPPWAIRSYWAGEDPLPILDYLLETHSDLDWLHAAVRRITGAA